MAKNTTVVKHYGRVSETPCFPGEKSQGITTDSENYCGDRELIRCSIFNTTGSFGQPPVLSQKQCDAEGRLIVKARLSCSVWILAAKLPRSALNVAVDSWVDFYFSPVSSSGDRMRTNPTRCNCAARRYIHSPRGDTISRSRRGKCRVHVK